MDAQEKALLDEKLDEETFLRDRLDRFAEEETKRIEDFRSSMHYHINKIKEDRVMDAIVAFNRRLDRLEERMFPEKDEDGSDPTEGIKLGRG